MAKHIHQHDHRTARRPLAPPAPSPAPAAGPAHQLLVEQQRIGNQAVQRQLRAGAAPPTWLLHGAPALGNQALQRLARADLLQRAPAPAAEPADAASRPTLRHGERGLAVRTLQEQLVGAGAALEVDSLFGPLTGRAVKAFQRAAGLDPDGIVGPLTWSRLQAGGVSLRDATPAPAPTRPPGATAAPAPAATATSAAPIVGLAAPEVEAPTTEAPAQGGSASVTDAIQTTLRGYGQVEIVLPTHDTVTVQSAYWISSREDRRPGHLAAVNAVRATRNVLKNVRYGKATPDEYRAFVQQAVDQAGELAAAGRRVPADLPQPGATTEAWARNLSGWIAERQIGIDCSGFVQEALRQIERETGQELTGDRVANAKELATGRGTERVAAPAELRPGDMMYLFRPGAINHIRILMAVERSTEPGGAGPDAREWVVFTTAESTAAVEGLAVRTFAFPAAAGSFAEATRQMKVKEGERWQAARSSEKAYTYHRRAPRSAATPS